MRLVRCKAENLRKELCMDYLDHDNVKEEGGDVDSTLMSVSATVEPTLRRWLADTGCPIDLISSSELASSEKVF